MKKKYLALPVSIMMAVSLLPGMAYAADSTAKPETSAECIRADT